MASKLVEIIEVLYNSIEGIDPNLESYIRFHRWQNTASLDTASDAASFRAFRIDVSSIGKGRSNSNSSATSMAATIEIKIGYPPQYFISGDSQYLGVEVIRADDNSLIVSETSYKNNTQIRSVNNITRWEYSSSTKSGSAWLIKLNIEYMETNS